MGTSRRVVMVAVTSASALVGGCSLLTSLDDLGAVGDTGGEADVFTTETRPEAQADAPGDVTIDGGQGLSDLTRWSAFDLTALGGSPTGLWGGAYDGRYVYFTPSTVQFVTSQLAYRFDTTGAFKSTTAWAKLDLSTVGAGATNFAGTAFDGRYLYLAPTWSATQTARYDTLAPFVQTTSWALFSAGPAFSNRQGAAFDGRFVYFASTTNTLTRFDTSQSYTSLASWASVDVTSFSDAGTLAGFTGAVWDGHYVYFLPPSPDFANGPSGVVLRYDSTAPFGASTAWSSFDTRRVSALAAGFAGGAFDGRYLYLAPNENQNAFDGLVVRYDTQAAFGATSSWEAFDAQTLSAQAVGFSGADFDGRYVYFSPHGFGNTGLVVRYDTQASFTLASSWTTFDAHAIDVNAGGFLGIAFDGEFMYFVPGTSHVIVRFDARAPSKPPESGGSFF